MLVLTRSIGTRIVIGEAGQTLTGPIVVTLVDMRREKARIGITADRDISVAREEIWSSENSPNGRDIE